MDVNKSDQLQFSDSLLFFKDIDAATIRNMHIHRHCFWINAQLSHHHISLPVFLPSSKRSQQNSSSSLEHQKHYIQSTGGNRRVETQCDIQVV